MKTVTICGSSRFAKEIREFAQELRNLGIVVYEPHLYRASGGVWSDVSDFDKPLVASGLTRDHFYKIELCDYVYVMNIGGYSGVSTSMEIAYAVAMKKPVYALSEKDDEVCRKILFSGYIDNAKDLFNLLK